MDTLERASSISRWVIPMVYVFLGVTSPVLKIWQPWYWKHKMWIGSSLGIKHLSVYEKPRYFRLHTIMV